MKKSFLKCSGLLVSCSFFVAGCSVLADMPATSLIKGPQTNSSSSTSTPGVTFQSFNTETENDSKYSFNFDYPTTWIHFGSIDGGYGSVWPFFVKEQYAQVCDYLDNPKATTCEAADEIFTTSFIHGHILYSEPN